MTARGRHSQLGEGRLRGRFSARSIGVWIPATIIAVIAFACFVLPVMVDLPEPIGGRVRDANRPLFSPDHLLGTDLNGNDMLSRLLHGGRASLEIALTVNLLALVVGGFLGSLSAYAKGVIDALVMRGVEILVAFPSLVLVICIAQAFGPTRVNTILALLALSIPVFARVARVSTLRLCERPFIAAAQISGTRAPRILLLHVAPNILPQLAAVGLMGIGVVITIEGAMSVLGLGTPAPFPSLGNMISHGQQALLIRPELVLLPSGALFLTVLAFSQLGEALRTRGDRS
jgi:peptide/nickel transport system permease protein